MTTALVPSPVCGMVNGEAFLLLFETDAAQRFDRNTRARRRRKVPVDGWRMELLSAKTVWASRIRPSPPSE
ncbi:hypothetical protein [Streptomyces halstedii]|uniref:Uncharacterized protein n=1 Tax=Streptomyces halstedii TaxID=1944 RepID=A0A6N9U8P6_STRHA|nr:hypothetical protein [Streptomyces halstedii]NEA18962.1 hypothetical protein [Streptomyces halstedii]